MKKKRDKSDKFSMKKILQAEGYHPTVIKDLKRGRDLVNADRDKVLKAAAEAERNKRKSKKKKPTWKFSNKDKVTASSIMQTGEDTAIRDGIIVGVWFNPIYGENYYVVKIKGYPDSKNSYSCAVYPESNIQLRK